MKTNRRRALRALLAVLIVMTVSFAGASINEWWRALPPPEQCSGEDLVRWMATRDLHREPLTTRRGLVERLAAHLHEGIDTQQIDDYLSAAQKRRFASNARLLMRTWFEDAAATYASLDQEAKAQFLDDQIARVEQWDLEALAKSLEADSSDTTGGSRSDGRSGTPWALAMLNAQISRWIEQAPASDQQALKEFASAIRMRLLVRAFQPFTSASSTSSS